MDTTTTARVGDKDLLFKSVPSKKKMSKESTEGGLKPETKEDGYFVWVNGLKFGSKEG